MHRYKTSFVDAGIGWGEVGGNVRKGQGHAPSIWRCRKPAIGVQMNDRHKPQGLVHDSLPPTRKRDSDGVIVSSRGWGVGGGGGGGAGIMDGV